MDLAQLLVDHCQPEEFMFQSSTGGQMPVIDQDHVQRRRKQITDFSHG